MACSALPLIGQQVEIVIGPTKIVKQKNGHGVPGELDEPFAVDFDAAGNMYIVEYHGGRLHKYSPEGSLTTLAGVHRQAGYQDGDALAATFKLMHNLVVLPNGEVLISDHRNNAIRRYRDGRVDTFVGNRTKGFAGDGGPANKAALNEAINVEISPDGKTLAIADLKNKRIRAVDLATGIITTVAGNGKAGVPTDGALAVEAPLVDPRACQYDAAGNLFIVERNGHALRVVKPDGRIYTIAGTGKAGKQDGPALQATMKGPKHLAVAADGTIYLADDVNHLIRKYDPNTKTLTTILGHGKLKLNRPHGVKIHNGWLYVADSYHHRIVRLKL